MQNFIDGNDHRIDGVTKTLLIPLWARAKESQRPQPLLSDPWAAQIVENLRAVTNYRDCLAGMDRSFDKFYQISQIVRAKCLDDEINDFLAVHSCGTVVNIGAGLDTTFARVDNGLLTWYDLDLPEVIDLRRRYLPETDRSRCIAKSVLDLAWLDELEGTDHGVLFVSCGVLFFLRESEVKRLWIDLADRFPGSEAAFDTMSRLFLAIGNRSVLRRSGMGSQAVMQWSLQRGKEIEKWDQRIAVVREYPMFSRIPYDPSWGRSVIGRMRIVNLLHGINILHLRLGNSGSSASGGKYTKFGV
jgi:O-methyltransferase involved in polyketide biosynthesis